MVASLPSSIPSQVEQFGQQKAVRLQLAREGCCSSPALTLSAALAAMPNPGALRTRPSSWWTSQW